MVLCCWSQADLRRQALARPPDTGLEGAVGSGDRFVGGCMQSHVEGYSHDHSLESHHRERIKKYIAAHINNPDLDVQSIAAAVGLSRRYVHKLFSNEPQHLMQWVLVQRLEHCRSELSLDRERHRTISDIALAWGFHDQSHFSKAFRKHF